MMRLLPRFSSLVSTAAVLALPFVFSVVACGSDDSSDDVKADGAPASTAPISTSDIDASPGTTDAAADGGSPVVSSSTSTVVFADDVEVTSYTRDISLTVTLATETLAWHANTLGSSPFVDSGVAADAGDAGPTMTDGSRTLSSAELAQLTTALDAIVTTAAACTATPEETLTVTVLAGPGDLQTGDGSGTHAYSDSAYCGEPTSRVTGAHAAYEVALSLSGLAR